MISTARITKTSKTIPDNAVFSILIPSWNNLDYLKNCIESIRKNSSFHHQIIVHINEGHDGTVEWVSQQNDLDYTFSAENIGVCYALNICRGLVATNYIVYMNDDMYVCPDWDKHLLEEVQNIGHPYFFLSATAIEPFPGNNCTLFGDYGNSLANFNEQKLLEEYASFTKDDWQGATWPPNIVHVSVWDMVGGYSTEFHPGFYSDPDFSMKLWQAGIRLFKGVNKSRVYHFGSKSTVRLSKDRNYSRFIAKWGITSSTFTRYYLHRGEKFTGPLPEVKLSWKQVIKNYCKQITAQLLIHPQK